MPLSRTLLKRPRDAFDSSPASSTPPQRPMKRFHVDSDASSDAFGFHHLPSDSPSNPFGRVRPFIPRELPQPTHVSEHIVLRFQLGYQDHSVYRIVAVPANYTFWHLHRLTQLLFGWKDTRKERNPRNRHLRIERRAEHVFAVQKRVQFYATAKNAGQFRNGRPVAYVTGNIKELRPLGTTDVPWEREECYTLKHLWHRSGSINDISRAVVYEYDALSPRKETVYISIHSDSEKLRLSLQDSTESSNIPRVLLGSGLPDDDDDDEDFALDLQQFNEPHAFENFILSQEDAEDDTEDTCSSVVRLAEEQALVKRRMSAPLPKRLPVDEDKHEDLEEDLPAKPQMLTTKAARITIPKPEKEGIRLPDPEESCEIGASYPTAHELSPVKKRPDAGSVYLPDPEESREIGAEDVVPHLRPAARKRMPLAPRLPDPEESQEIDAVYPKAPRKRASTAPRRDEHEDHADLSDECQSAPRKRMPLEHLLDSAETLGEEESVDIPRLPRHKRISYAPRTYLDEESPEIYAVSHRETHRRVSVVPRLPDPEESREIGDERPVASRKSRGPFHPAKPLHRYKASVNDESTWSTEEVDGNEESEAEV